ncbi:transcription antitermination factor NusB [Buchnera aphidicola (Pemphigus obesinymphae)]|uniref:transcription antitermination factor NusB n=1 Tax=Buchnera aphidicola TaxID=9 RepID=UPI002238AC50|nr:transcription antitermination factor NusB [Buchnera aphidicola]MCW5196369.1 transcription antitermination factor NusB [Buchnera aphidicola (Pemphigus obesinymphae)]
MKPNSRRKARECIIQVLYSWQISKNNIDYIISQFLEEKNIKQIDINYFHEIIIGIVKNCKYIDESIRPFLSRTLEEVGQVEKSILRLSFYELLKRLDIPYRVSINESIELAKSFGAEDSHKFINGVLDKAAWKIRIHKAK